MRIAAIFAALMIIATPVVSQDGNGSDSKVEADKLYNEGNSLYRSGNFSGAAEKYVAALALAEDYKYRYQLGLSYKNLKEPEKAITEYEKAVGNKPDFAIGHYALGGAYLGAREYAKSIEAFKLCLRYNPQMDRAKKGISEAYAGEGQRLMSAGKFEDAGAIVDEALQQNSDNPKLYLLAARVYNRLEQPEKAIDAAKSALKLKTRGSKGAEYFELGVAYKKVNDIAQARAAFMEAKKDPTYSRNAQYELDGLKGK